MMVLGQTQDTFVAGLADTLDALPIYIYIPWYTVVPGLKGVTRIPWLDLYLEGQATLWTRAPGFDPFA